MITLGSHTKLSIHPEKGLIKKSILEKDDFELELKTTLAARKVATESGLFYVPKILDVDFKDNSIVFEYLPSLIPLSVFLYTPSKSTLLRYVEQAGTILSTIHSFLNVDDTKVFIPIKFSGGSPLSFLHGDYTLNNVQLDCSCGKIVILDWALTPLVRPPGNWGPVYWDISWMLNSIFISSPYLDANFNERKLLADCFIRSYQQRSSFNLDCKELSSYCDDVFWRYLQISWKEKRFFLFLLQLRNRYGLKRYAKHLSISIGQL